MSADRRNPGTSSLIFVPVDFERSTLAEGLRQAAFCDSEPAFFSWLGVTMYLEEDAVMSHLAFYRFSRRREAELYSITE